MTTPSERGSLGGMGAHHRPSEGESNEWYTPPSVFRALGIDFDLDPCAPEGGVPWVPAAKSYHEALNGLEQPWEGKVWLNPPYGPHTETWLRKMVLHGNGVALVFARSDTAWFHEIVPSAQSMCLLEGRLTFWRPDGTPAPFNSGAPSMLLGWGDECSAAVVDSGLGLVFDIEARALRQSPLF